MRGEITGERSHAEFPLEEMPKFSAGILTRVPYGAAEEIGDPVIRLRHEYDFLGKSETFATLGDGTNEGYYCRLLAPGEQLIVTNED